MQGLATAPAQPVLTSSHTGGLERSPHWAGASRRERARRLLLLHRPTPVGGAVRAPPGHHICGSRDLSPRPQGLLSLAILAAQKEPLRVGPLRMQQRFGCRLTTPPPHTHTDLLLPGGSTRSCSEGWLTGADLPWGLVAPGWL